MTAYDSGNEGWAICPAGKFDDLSYEEINQIRMFLRSGMRRLVKATALDRAVPNNTQRRLWRQFAALVFSWVATDVVAATDSELEPHAMPEVVVTATRDAHSSFDLPIAIDRIDGEQARDQRLGVNVSEALHRVPGVTSQSRETYAQEQQITLRGFGARSQFGVRGIKVLVDGIPASTPDGQGSTGLFDLASAKSIEVMRGGFSSLYGNHSGGVIQILTEDGPELPTLSTSLAMGSNSTRRAVVKFGGTSGAINYIGSISRFDTDGYRNWSTARKEQSNVKLMWQTDADTTLTLTANYLDQPDSHDPLGLSASEMAANPRQSNAVAKQFQTRRSLDNLQGGLSLKHAVSTTDSLLALLYVGQRSNEQYLAIPLTAQNSLTSSGGVSAFDRDFYGAGLRWIHAHENTRITMGVDYEFASDDRQGWVNNNGAKGALKRNETDQVGQTGAYLQTEQSLARDWIASGGLRYTQVNFDSRDFFICTTIGASCSGSSQTVTTINNNPDDSGATEYAAWTGALGIVYKFAPHINFYANAGRSFETPAFTELAYRSGNQTGLNLELDHSRSRQYEVGIKALAGTDTRLNLALFHIDTKDEIIVDTSAGGRTSYRNAGKTRRQGLEVSMDGKMNRHWSGSASVTWLDAVFSEGFAGVGGRVAPGNRLPGISPYNAYGEVVWRDLGERFSTALEVRLNGKAMVNDINSEAAAGYAIVNWRIGFHQESGVWRISEFLRADNIFNRRYVGSIYVNDANGRFYAPAPERNYLIGASVALRY